MSKNYLRNVFFSCSHPCLLYSFIIFGCSSEAERVMDLTIFWMVHNNGNDGRFRIPCQQQLLVTIQIKWRFFFRHTRESTLLLYIIVIIVMNSQNIMLQVNFLTSIWSNKISNYWSWIMMIMSSMRVAMIYSLWNTSRVLVEKIRVPR